MVLYLDRLDFYRVERTDQEIMSAITNMFGPKIWRNTIIGLTHGKAVAPPEYDKQSKCGGHVSQVVQARLQIGMQLAWHAHSMVSSCDDQLQGCNFELAAI